MTVVVERAPQRRRTFEVVDDAGWAAVHKILKIFEEDMGVVVELKGEQQPEPELPTCQVCQSQTLKVELHPHLGRDVCLVCWRTADRILAQFSEDRTRHEREFFAQYERMVKDVRAGADEPTFYRGLE